MDEALIDTPSTQTRTDAALAKGLRAPGWLARRPAIAVSLVLLGFGSFCLIALQVQTNGPLIQFDLWLNEVLHAAALNSPPVLRAVMIFGYYMGQHVIIGIGVVLLVYFVYKRFWPEATMVVIAWAGEGALWMTLSNLFERPRPLFDTPIWHHMTAPGFPSGHSISAVMCYGLLAYLIVPKMHTRLGRAAVIVAAVVIVLYIGFSRVFIGDHYASDVLAGFALGVAWSALVYTSIEWIALRRR